MEKHSDTDKNGQTVESSSLEGRAQRSSGLSRTAQQEEAHASVRNCGYGNEDLEFTTDRHAKQESSHNALSAC